VPAGAGLRAPEVVAGPDGWEAAAWSLRWEAYTAGVREVRAGGHALVRSMDGTGMVPLAGADLETARPAAMVRADWVEAGPLRWAAEAQARDAAGQWVRIEYIPSLRSVRGEVGGAGWGAGVRWWRLPLAGAGEPIVAAAPQSGELAAAWPVAAPPGVLALSVRAAGGLALAAPANAAGCRLRWELPDPAAGAHGPLLAWELRWAPATGAGSATALAERALAELVCRPCVEATVAHAGRLVAAGAGCVLRGPLRWAGPPRVEGSSGEWLLPLAIAATPAASGAAEVWLAARPAAARWSPAPQSAAPGPWSSVPVIGHTLRLDAAALGGASPILVRIEW